MDFRRKRPLIFYGVLISIQVCLAVVLFVYAARGKSFMDESERGSGLPYYAGAILVGCVNICLAISALLLVICYVFSIKKGSNIVLYLVCMFVYLGPPAFILALVFTVLFGLADCKKNENTPYDLNGFCSYDNNIDNNHNTAVVCLVVIILIFLTNLVNVFLLCKYGGDLKEEQPIRKRKKRKRGWGRENASFNRKGENRSPRVMGRDRKVHHDEKTPNGIQAPGQNVTMVRPID